MYLQQVAAEGDAENRRVLFMSDCYNALRAIEDTWRGRSTGYRQRAGGAKIEAINTLRTKLERVVFLYVPSHSGVVPNAYADGVAKAYLARQHKLRIGKVVARHVRSRSIIYEKRVGDDAQLKDGPTYKHARKGVMEWVRTRSTSVFRGDDGRRWNQGVMKAVGKGPAPPTDTDEKGQRTHVTPEEATAYAKRAKCSLRITSGYRTGYIAGGAQGETAGRPRTRDTL